MPPATDASPGWFLARFREFLRDRRLPVTRQRDLIAELLAGGGGHLSAEMIERELREQGHRVGTATVYRTLQLLVEAGLARQHQFGDGFRRFEAVIGDAGHEHLICERCGRVVEFDNERLERMLPVIADEHGFAHAHHRVEVFGVCRDCRRRDVALR